MDQNTFIDDHMGSRKGNFMEKYKQDKKIKEQREREMQTIMKLECFYFYQKRVRMRMREIRQECCKKLNDMKTLKQMYPDKYGLIAVNALKKYTVFRQYLFMMNHYNIRMNGDDLQQILELYINVL